MLGRCGGVGIRGFFFDGETSFDLVGEAGGVTGRSEDGLERGRGSVKVGLVIVSLGLLSTL